MRLSDCFVSIHESEPSDAKAYMRNAGLVDSFEGVSLTYLPIGNLVLKKLIALIDKEMRRAGAQEIVMPAFVPEQAIIESKNVTHGTFQNNGVWFSSRGQKYFLMPTNEETAAYLYGKLGTDFSFQEKAYYQTTRKYRDESALDAPVRMKEFFMHDVYSFTTDKAYIEPYYQKFNRAYCDILDQLELEYYLTTDIPFEHLGAVSQEILAPVPDGKDRFEVINLRDRLVQKYPEDAEVRTGALRGLEIAHVYKLYDAYSGIVQKMQGRYRQLFMNGHGMGLDRVIYAVVSQRRCDGMVQWPEALLPFRVVIIPRNERAYANAENWYLRMINEEAQSVAMDDRGISLTDMIVTSKRLGIPYRIEVDEKRAYLIDNNAEQISLLENIMAA